MNYGMGLGLLLAACGGQQAHGTEAGAGASGSSSAGSSGSFSTAESGTGGRGEEPPVAQAAALVQLKPVSPAPAGKMCPSGAAFRFQMPEVESSVESLSASTYLHHVADGEPGVSVSCSVVGSAGFSFSGEIRVQGKSLLIENGQVTGSQGSADISVGNSAVLSGSLSSSAPCKIDVGMSPGQYFQIKPGSMWASFSCASVERPPSDSCAAQGFFVLENCEGS
jgi:hypothetical protein